MINKIAEEQENLSIDDEEDEMKNNFLRQNPQYSDIMAEEQNEMEVETCEPNKKKKKGKKKSRSVYSDALMIASMSGEELEEYRRANTGETSTTTADTTGSTETDHWTYVAQTMQDNAEETDSWLFVMITRPFGFSFK